VTKLLFIAAALSLFAQGALAQQAEKAFPTLRPPSEPVSAYVRRQPLPGNPVQVTEAVTVGKALAGNLRLTIVPIDSNYAFAVVNQQRLIVDPRTHVVIQILD